MMGEPEFYVIHYSDARPRIVSARNLDIFLEENARNGHYFCYGWIDESIKYASLISPGIWKDTSVPDWNSMVRQPGNLTMAALIAGKGAIRGDLAVRRLIYAEPFDSHDLAHAVLWEELGEANRWTLVS